jgi:hypothetical protein
VISHLASNRYITSSILFFSPTKASKNKKKSALYSFHPSSNGWGYKLNKIWVKPQFLPFYKAPLYIYKYVVFNDPPVKATT